MSKTNSSRQGRAIKKNLVMLPLHITEAIANEKLAVSASSTMNCVPRATLSPIKYLYTVLLLLQICYSKQFKEKIKAT